MSDGRSVAAMNCFVIMPFSDEFDDVYAAIKGAVEAAAPGKCKCFRLDESRPAGSITSRLISELESAGLCVADLTGLKPNVMWEVGYAMALKKPTLIVTQDSKPLPFDILQMQHLRYERSRLTRTLDEPLRRMVVDTLSKMRLDVETAPTPADALVGQLRDEMVSIKQMVALVVGAWQPPAAGAATQRNVPDSLSILEGAWVNDENDTHLYAKAVDGDLIVPYCFRGDSELTGFYYGWRRTGDYWFARFTWTDESIKGFAFLRHESVDLLKGAWWYGSSHDAPTDRPNSSGIAASWRRIGVDAYPAWATRLLSDVASRGVAAVLAKR